MRCLLAVFLSCAVAQAGDPGKVCDRNGVLLMEVERNDSGPISRTFPLRAFASHLLADLQSDVLPQAGETVFLTIDARVQMAAEKSLRAVPRGCAVIVDSRNGDVLAMASVPSFNPSAPDDPTLQNDETEPLRNRATSACSPGATFLPVTALAGLRAGLRDFSFTCTGTFPVGTKVMKCWMADQGNDSGHDFQVLPQGMKNSCGPFFYALGIAAGPEAIFTTAELFGFGERSGLPLREEEAGRVSLKKYLAQQNSREVWSDGYTANTSIGQGMVQTTPLQMASFAASVAEGKEVEKLRLVDRVEHPDGTVSRPELPVGANLENAGLHAEDLEIVREAMRTSTGPGGNAQKGAIPGFAVGGRTGTAQIWRSGKKDNLTAFVGFAASKKNHYAFSILVQGAKSGGGVAAPLAARIITSIGSEEPASLEPAKGAFSFVESLEKSGPAMLPQDVENSPP